MTPLQETSPSIEPAPEVRPTQTVVLAGRDAFALRDLLHHQFAAHTIEFAAADTILEAVLISNSAEDAPSDKPAVPLVVAGVSQELDQLEAAVHSLRKVYPVARIILVCEPEDEVACRKALTWGATDYLILPADPRSIERLCTLAPPPAQRLANRMAAMDDTAPLAPADLLRKVVEIPATAPAADEKLPKRALSAPHPRHGHAHDDIAMPGLPLLVQTSLMTDLLNGRSDIPDRILATLQGYVQWPGNLRFLSADPIKEKPEQEPPEDALRLDVMLPGHPALGTLFLEAQSPDAPWPPAGVEPALAQAAHWMATLLSLSRRYEQLRSLAITDELSGAYNRRYFNKFMQGLLERARTNRFRVTLLLFDIDDFKKYNDTFGHASGDAIIRELIKLLRLCTRPDDLVARLGGDEFAVVYWDHEAPRQPNSEHPKDVLSATERFRKAIKNHPWPEICKIRGEVSISGGLATFPWDADTLETLMARADEALLRAKAAGKNAILLHASHNPMCDESPAES